VLDALLTPEIDARIQRFKTPSIMAIVGLVFLTLGLFSNLQESMPFVIPFVLMPAVIALIMAAVEFSRDVSRSRREGQRFIWSARSRGGVASILAATALWTVMFPVMSLTNTAPSYSIFLFIVLPAAFIFVGRALLEGSSHFAPGAQDYIPPAVAADGVVCASCRGAAISPGTSYDMEETSHVSFGEIAARFLLPPLSFMQGCSLVFFGQTADVTPNSTGRLVPTILGFIMVCLGIFFGVMALISVRAQASRGRARPINVIGLALIGISFVIFVLWPLFFFVGKDFPIPLVIGIPLFMVALFTIGGFALSA
jgi:hypothetical protein